MNILTEHDLLHANAELTGLAPINKPIGITSMDVIRQLRRITGIKKIGHAGTLDPLATGVLLVCIGRQATKNIDQLMNMDKTYKATVNLSAFSETDDAEGKLTTVHVSEEPTLLIIQKTLKSFIGTQQQVPPLYSAIKIGGQPAYKRARKNQNIELGARTICIHAITLLSYEWPELNIEVHCGKGTYIRSLARDIGKKLRTGGYITKLKRTTIGPYHIHDCIDLAKLKKRIVQ